MPERIYFNQKILPAGHAAHSPLSSAALHGKGIFTTIAIYDGRPFLWEKHWRRLFENATTLNIDLSGFSEESTESALKELIEKNNVTDGRARITFFDESASAFWPFESDRKASLLITTADRKPVPHNFLIKMSLNRVSSLSKLAAIKSCNYLDNIIAYEDARKTGFDEAIRLNEGGEVAGACMANVFWASGGQLFTPSVRTGCLPGTTREFILENLECDEVEELYDKIYKADSIFLTSAGLGVVQASDLAGWKPKISDHPILHLIPQK